MTEMATTLSVSPTIVITLLFFHALTHNRSSPIFLEGGVGYLVEKSFIFGFPTHENTSNMLQNGFLHSSSWLRISSRDLLAFVG